MGYISDVASTVYGPTDRVKAFLVAHRMKGEPFNVFNIFKDDINVGTCLSETHIVLRGQYKWYSGYDSVAAWEKFLADAEVFGLNYEFIRVGEDQTDIERTEGGNPEYYLQVCTSIELSTPEFTDTLENWLTKQKSSVATNLLT